MYEDVKTWNGMYGICSHNCIYCYNRKWWKTWGKMRFNEKAFKKNLGSNNMWFVGSSCDMFAKDIPNEWILSVLGHIKKYQENVYLLQSKNPQRFNDFDTEPRNMIWGTTLETNRDGLGLKYSDAPLIKHRRYWMLQLPKSTRRFITIEPIMEFDLYPFVDIIKGINPDFVYIGADSKGHNLPEPSLEKVKLLVEELNKFTKVIEKDNLKRLLSQFK